MQPKIITINIKVTKTKSNVLIYFSTSNNTVFIDKWIINSYSDISF